MDAPPQTNAKALSQFLGQIRWHSRMISYLSNSATLLHTTVHRTPFQWSTAEQNVYDYLIKMSSRVLLVQPRDWSKDFRVFVDASDIAIGSALMQLSKPNWHRQTYYASKKLSTPERNYSKINENLSGWYILWISFDTTFSVRNLHFMWITLPCFIWCRSNL